MQELYDSIFDIYKSVFQLFESHSYQNLTNCHFSFIQPHEVSLFKNLIYEDSLFDKQVNHHLYFNSGKR